MCDAFIVDKAAVSSVGVEIVSYSLLFLVDVVEYCAPTEVVNDMDITLNITSLRLKISIHINYVHHYM